MKAINYTLIIAGLFSSAVCLADDTKQHEKNTPVSSELQVIKTEIDVEQTLDNLQQQLADSIRQQVRNTISSFAESIKTLAQ